MTQNAQRGEADDAPDIIRHAVLLGDALENIDLGPEQPERALVPQPRNPWKLTVVPPEHVLRSGPMRAIPGDASHVAISLDGGWAIETSGLLSGQANSIQEALDTLAAAADEFGNIFSALVTAALETGLPTAVCTLVPARFYEPAQQRVAATALAIFNERIERRAVAARLPIVDLRLVCDEDADYATETLLSRAGVRKVANVVRTAFYEMPRSGGRTRVFF
jgi:hypothetical protein